MPPSNLAALSFKRQEDSVMLPRAASTTPPRCEMVAVWVIRRACGNLISIESWNGFVRGFILTVVLQRLTVQNSSLTLELSRPSSRDSYSHEPITGRVHLPATPPAQAWLWSIWHVESKAAEPVVAYRTPPNIDAWLALTRHDRRLANDLPAT